MSDKIKDDPRQVLAILNSLGIVGVTAEELKIFMKELKIYRKIKEKERQYWKEELKTKLLKKHYCYYSQNKENQNEQNIEEKVISAKSQEHNVGKDKLEKPKQKNSIEIVVKTHQKQKPNEKIAENSKQLSKSIATVKITPKSPRKTCSDSQPQENLSHKVQNKIQQEIRPASAPECVQKIIIRPSRRRTKSITSSNTREESAESHTRSKSFIRKKNSFPEPKVTKKNKPINDPVALYEKYAAFWSKLSLPGEESHSKLRWAVREKMMGSVPVPQPTTQYKKPGKVPLSGRIGK